MLEVRFVRTKLRIQASTIDPTAVRSFLAPLIEVTKCRCQLQFRLSFFHSPWLNFFLYVGKCNNEAYFLKQMKIFFKSNIII